MEKRDKQKYTKELKILYRRLDVGRLLINPDESDQIELINRAIAILKNFSHDIGVELEKKRDEFQTWARAGNRPEHSKNLAKDILQFISQKTEEMAVYRMGASLTSENRPEPSLFRLDP